MHNFFVSFGTFLKIVLIYFHVYACSHRTDYTIFIITIPYSEVFVVVFVAVILAWLFGQEHDFLCIK